MISCLRNKWKINFRHITLFTSDKLRIIWTQNIILIFHRNARNVVGQSSATCPVYLRRPLIKITIIRYKLFLPCGERSQSAILLLSRPRNGATRATVCVSRARWPLSPSTPTPTTASHMVGDSNIRLTKSPGSNPPVPRTSTSRSRSNVLQQTMVWNVRPPPDSTIRLVLNENNRATVHDRLFYARNGWSSRNPLTNAWGDSTSFRRVAYSATSATVRVESMTRSTFAPTVCG